jgi:hypothetical protein
MADIRKLDPHAPLPASGSHVVLLRRFEEDDPRRIMLEVIVLRPHEPPRSSLAQHPDGRAMSIREAVEHARALADAEGLDHITIIDRLAGPREREILRAHGDHSVHMEHLQDFDWEDGQRGPDMRDRRP